MGLPLARSLIKLSVVLHELKPVRLLPPDHRLDIHEHRYNAYVIDPMPVLLGAVKQ